ncbi:hypothetical protein A3F27_03290 [Candidatus Kaiserbacteria bacterium RIFCSPHIGHO2_12_FULL_53_13]|uniref:Uncharacterized protein n=1 Tax=Candidatus Kaiserbacteria bacterium RIFCSPHIGHO2_12_FULL_53_13 TaxID=1798502 RepID=A0A1F6E8N2_9BACT|nr:MAG: hypothetical protein A3F27_03290 [Candidatus Kaiserbacteria bacterium RIFCSPHIGHO2_12_FULL_53_13]
MATTWASKPPPKGGGFALGQRFKSFKESWHVYSRGFEAQTRPSVERGSTEASRPNVVIHRRQELSGMRGGRIGGVDTYQFPRLRRGFGGQVMVKHFYKGHHLWLHYLVKQ